MPTYRYQHRTICGVAAASAALLLTVVGSAVAATGSSVVRVRAAAGSTAVKTVTVPLKPAWRVTRASQLIVSDGAMRCRVTKLVRRKGRAATAAKVRCSVRSALAGRPGRLTIRVKRRKGAKRTVIVTFRPGTSKPGGQIPGTPAQPQAPAPPPPVLSLGAIQRVNTDAAGNGADAEAGSPTWSPDGTKVAFRSRATNLVPGVSDGFSHVYLKTPATGAIQIVDTAQNGTPGNDGSSGGRDNSGLAFRPDGSELLFCSAASNLGPGDPGGDATFAKSLTDGSVGWVGPGCGRPAWSPDGTKIAFETEANFAAGEVDNGQADTNWATDVYMPVTYTPYVVRRISTDSSGAGSTQTSNGDSHLPRFSPDSQKVVFESRVTTLVPGDTNVSPDIFVKDLDTNQTTRISTSSTGTQASGNSADPAWSPDGTRIAFDSDANTLVPGDTNVHPDIFIKNLGTGALTLASTKADGSPALWQHYRPTWSPDGRRIVFDSRAVDLIPIPNDSNTRADIFVKDLTTGFVQLVSASPAGVIGESDSTLFGGGPTSFSHDGTKVLFESNSTNLAPGDGNAFGSDIFIKTITP